MHFTFNIDLGQIVGSVITAVVTLLVSHSIVNTLKKRISSNMIAALLKHPRTTIKEILVKHRILEFMLVGGIGYSINMAIYYPLTLVFKSDVLILGQHFYLSPFLISSCVAITSNYFMNKAWTFKDKDTQKQSYLRYLSTYIVTVIAEIVLLWLMVDFGHLQPSLAAAIAILIMFLSRYTVVKRWVWHK